MKQFSPKKARNQQRKNDVIINATLDAIKGIRKGKLSSRVKFVSWLLWGRGDWKGVK